MEDRSSVGPRVRFSLLWRITLPFMLLAMILGFGAAYLINRFISEDDGLRFQRQLVNSGQQAADSVVRVEIDLLELERLIANTEGVADAAAAASAEDLRIRVLPLVVNAGADVVAVLDKQGTSLLTVRRRPDANVGDYDTLRGETYYAQWPFVQQVLEGVSDEVVGDKHAGMEPIVLEGVDRHVFFVAGPLFDSAQTLKGAVLVGEYSDRLVATVENEAAANVSIYALATGEALSSTLELSDPSSLNLTAEELASVGEVEQARRPVRSILVAGTEYWEVLTPLVVREQTVTLGTMGVSLLRVPVQTGTEGDLSNVLRFGVVGLVLTVLIGLLLSNSITRPLTRLVEASAKVAMGNLEAQVPERGTDEIGVLGKTFNRMVEGLREGSIYRDLLGRTVTPEVRAQLRTAFSDGALLLKGQNAEATILFADFRGYTSMAENTDPALVMKTLNDYFSGVVPIISLHGGVVNKFDGDSVMAFFGILPRYLPPRVSALQATHAGLAMLEHIHKVNRERERARQPSFQMGIGISTGTVIAGGLGSEDRVHYTVVGDTVNTAQRIQEASQTLGGTALVIAESTYRKLGAVRSQFQFGQTGRAALKGKQREVMVYQVLGRKSRLVEEAQLEQQVKHYTASLPRITQILSGQPTDSNEQPEVSPEERDFLKERLPPSEGVEEL
jgi:adenylate cyclase